MTEINNAKQWPEMYYCRHMLSGVAKYNLENGGEEFIFVDTPTIKKMMPSFIGKPVYVYHQNVDLENIDNADGYVTESFYNELDGWAWCKFIIKTDAGHKAIKDGWSVSNSYLPIQWNEKGTHLSVDFDREITEAQFQHLAIVPDPRYEKAKIFSCEEFKQYQEEHKQQLNALQNNKGVKKMLNIFKRTKVENIADAKEGDIIELENGLTAIISNAKMKNDDSKKNDDEKFDLKTLINDAVESYMKKHNKKNTSQEESEDRETEEEIKDKKASKKNKKNDDDSEDEASGIEKKASKKNDDDMKNSKSSDENHFEELRNAHNVGAKEQVNVIESTSLKEARGLERYGKKN